MSQPIRLRDSPWPERVGCDGVTVDDPGDGVYPFNGRGKDVVIHLRCDPLQSERTLANGDRWTCVVDPADLEWL